jgi:hypothetical protein
MINLGFLTEGKLAAIFIKPSLGVPNWPVIYFINSVASASLGDKKYCLVIVDDYSRYTWVYFFKHKSETQQTVIDFAKEVERQLGQNILAI